MKAGPGSLERRLWLGLAVLTLAALVLVSTLVYAMTASHLAERQRTTLQNMTHLVHLLLGDAPAAGGLSPQALGARLDEHFAGHADLSLQITDAAGALRYQSRHRVPPQRRATLAFALQPAASAWGAARAELSLDTLADQALLRHLGWTLAAASLLGAVVVGAGGRWLVRQGVEPVAHLVQQIGALDTRQVDLRLDGSRQPAELQPLVAQFNRLLGRVTAAYRQLDGFNADVAHELNTPLSTLIASTEIALRKQRDPAALREVLGSHLEELQRMSGMVKDMLFLASADRGAQARRAPVPSLAKVAAALVDYHEAVLVERGLRAEIVGEASGDFDLGLLQRALSNLLGNAARFATAGSTVRIELSQPEADTARLAVVNQGPPIDAADLGHLFERMFRAEASRAQADAHHGLGLAIVAAVARMHGGRTLAEPTGSGIRIGVDLRRGAAAPSG